MLPAKLHACQPSYKLTGTADADPDAVVLCRPECSKSTRVRIRSPASLHLTILPLFCCLHVAQQWCTLRLAPRRLLTLGNSPVVAVEQLDAEGQQLLQQGLQPPPLPAPAVQQLVGQVGDLGLGLGPDEGAAAGDDAGGRASADLGKRQAQSLTGVESRVPKEVQRLVHFLEVGVAVAELTCRVSLHTAGFTFAAHC